MEQIATRHWLIGASELIENKHQFYKGEVVRGLLGIAFSDSGYFVVVSEDNGYLNLVDKGGKHRTHRVCKSTVRPISKRFGIGFYYEDEDMPEFLSEKEVNMLVEEAEQEKARIEKEKEEKQKADAALSEKYRTQYSFLTYFEPGTFPKRREVSQNMRIWLKHEFPGEKFSVRMNGYDTILITCTNKGIKNQVEKSVSIFSNHENDITGDYRDCKPSVFTKCFGGWKYIFVD